MQSECDSNATASKPHTIAIASSSAPAVATAEKEKSAPCPPIDPHWTDSVAARLTDPWPDDLCRSVEPINKAITDALNTSGPDADATREVLVKNAGLYLAECSRKDKPKKALHNWIADGDWRTDYSTPPEKVDWSGKLVRLPDGREGRVEAATADKLHMRIDGEAVEVSPAEVEAI